MPTTHQDMQVDGVAPAASTALARRSTSVSTNTGSAHSTVTRTTGSVPDGRRNARPRPASIACTADNRSEEHTSELQSLMRIQYAVVCLEKKNITLHNRISTSTHQ